MRKSAVGLAAVLVIAMVVGALAPGQGVQAQTYPPPVGSLSVEASSTIPGSTTDVTATVLDSAGNPVGGAQVTFSIVSQPGSGAKWSNGLAEITAITGTDGVATAVLSAGASTGNIIIETVSGEKTSQVIVAVQETALPPTGGAPASDGNGVPAWQIVFLVIGGAALAAGLTIMARRIRKAQ